MIGDTLYPLNSFKESNPEVFEKMAEKYQGREVLMTRKLPTLNCLWNDVLHFSPLNPQTILDTWYEHDLRDKVKEFEVLKIPVGDLNQENLIYFWPQVYEYGNFEFSSKQVRTFCLDEYREQKSVGEDQLNAWKKDIKEGRRMFWYSHTTHVLYKGSVSTSNLETLVCG